MRPNNYLQEYTELKQVHEQYYRQVEEVKQFERGETLRTVEQRAKEAKGVRVAKVLRTVEEIETGERVADSVQKNDIRKHLSQVLAPVISQGVLRVVEIQPHDPVDYLAEYLFDRSFDY